MCHGPDLRGVVHIEGCDQTGISGRIKTSPQAASLFSSSEEPSRLTDPLALDSVFQMVILWCWEHHDLPALPIRVGRYRQRAEGYPSAGELRATVCIKENKGPMIEADIEITDLEGRLISRLEGAVCFESEQLIEEYRQSRLEDEFPPALASADATSADGASADRSGADFVSRELWPTDR